MGIDASIGIRCEFGCCEVANEMSTRVVSDLGRELFWDDHPIIWDGNTYWVDSTQRHYAPGYERGHWPTIQKLIAWLRDQMVGQIIYDGKEFTVVDQMNMNAHWMSVGNNRCGRSIIPLDDCPVCEVCHRRVPAGPGVMVCGGKFTTHCSCGAVYEFVPGEVATRLR